MANWSGFPAETGQRLDGLARLQRRALTLPFALRLSFVILSPTRFQLNRQLRMYVLYK